MNNGSIIIFYLFLDIIVNSKGAKTSTTTRPTPTKKSGLNGNDLIFLVTGCSIGGVIIILLCVVIFCLWKRSKQSNLQRKDNHAVPNNYEPQSSPQRKKHFSDSSSTEMALVNDGYEPAPLIKSKPAAKPLPVEKPNFSAKSYGEMGQTSASPFIGSGVHSNRLCSITSISPSPSMEGISIAQHLLDERRASSSTIISNLSQSRRDSGYVDVNVSHIIKKRFHASEMKQRHSSSPSSSAKQTTYHGFGEMKNDKSRCASESAQDSNSKHPEIFRHASTGQALEYCKKAKESLPREFRINSSKKQLPRGSQYENVQVGEASNESTDDEHDYTPVGEFNIQTTYTANGYQIVSKDSGQDNHTLQYEVPQDVNNQHNNSFGDNRHYRNLNVQVDTEYQNFDYHVPVLNPTSVDDENVYLEFIPDCNDNTTNI